jgi:hypothetical protein
MMRNAARIGKPAFICRDTNQLLDFPDNRADCLANRGKKLAPFSFSTMTVMKLFSIAL